MSADVRHDAEDLEPELRGAGKAPAKKPLTEFLAEFEARLASHPEEPATGAMRALEERAGGLRRTPADALPTRYAVEAEGVPLDDEVEVDEAPGAAIPLEPAPVVPSTAAPATESPPDATPGESRRLRGRRRRKHRHKAH